ncbi:MAG TPA: VIT family protein, partial [Candidatus Paceibacterota bacterium]|nr:VIT family protein [Candidatus Paceibacterota bacterium]
MNTVRSHPEVHTDSAASQLNWLRAAVLGANDGIVSLAALVVGVAGATEAMGPILITGIAGLLAGALSMAVGEYVSVSSQRDTELSLIAKEKYELEHYPEAELEELTAIYEKKGLSHETASHVARELTAHDAFAAHAEAELHFDPEELTNPWHAAFASGSSF